jgi:biopolymer transport protein ExbD
MDVLMSVLTFFIIISMTLSQQRSLEVQLPQNVRDETQEMTLSDLKNQFVVNLDAKGQAFQKKEALSAKELQAQVRQYLQDHPQGTVFLQPDPQLSYEALMQKLDQLRTIGGDRISLVIE